MMTGTHRMDRRSVHHHYSWPGMYHVTVKVNDAFRQPLGRIVGDVGKADGEADAPRVELSDAGRMVEQELTTSITAHYPMVEVQDHIVMPDHLHFIVVVRRNIVSASGRGTHLGQLMAGFKKGCNRRFWELTGPQQEQQQGQQQGKPAATGDGCLAVYPQGYKVPSNGTTGREPLFSYGYVDVMPIDERQLEQQRQYIRNNPRSRLMRTQNRAWLHTQRLAVPTALSPSALKGYLQRECSPAQINDDAWLRLQDRLLTLNGSVACDSYGNQQLLTQRLLPVVCHRCDTARFDQQKQACVAAAQDGAVLVSARIAKGEQIIMDEAVRLSLPVVLVEDNGFPDKYHPSEKRIQQCAEGKLLLVSPWQYRYRPADEGISVVQCKTMNCVVQSLCCLKDSWWK